MRHGHDNIIVARTANRWPFGAITMRITLRSLLDHVVLGSIFCVTGAAIATFSGLVLSGVIALPMIAPLALPILSCSRICFAGGTAMVGCHFFWRTLRRKPPPHERQSAESDHPPPNVIPAQTPDPAPIFSDGWTHEQIAAAFESKFKDVDVTTMPWLEVGLPNNGGRCFANTALQSLFHMPDFRSLIYLIIKLVPNAKEIYPLAWCTYKIMWHIQCNPTIPLPQAIIKLLLRSADKMHMEGVSFFVAGQHDAQAFLCTLLGGMSDYFGKKDKFKSFEKHITNGGVTLMEAELAVLDRLYIFPERKDPCSVLRKRHEWDGHSECIFFIFSLLANQKCIDMEGVVFSDHIRGLNGIGIELGVDDSLQSSLNAFLSPQRDELLNEFKDKVVTCDICYAPVDAEHLTFTTSRTNGAGDYDATSGIQIDPIIHLPSESGGRRYILDQIFCHIGNSPDSGHYVIYAHCDDGKWRRFSDSDVSEVREETLQSKIDRWKTNGTVDGETFARAVYKAGPLFPRGATPMTKPGKDLSPPFEWPRGFPPCPSANWPKIRQN
jgi:hypothetical protein